jgi:erythromycin esterase
VIRRPLVNGSRLLAITRCFIAFGFQLVRVRASSARALLTSIFRNRQRRMTSWLSDFHVAVRILRRDPLFAVRSVIGRSGVSTDDETDRTTIVNGISRRSVIKAGCACLGVAFAPAAVWGQSSDDDALQRWIEQNAVGINTGPDADGIAREAERLIAGIGNARIVMLGEPSHGAGAAFAAKVRLIRLLHERLRFDVLVWESGLIDLERTEAGLRGDLDPVDAAQRGILKIWSASTECRPLFAYAKASHSGARPLTMAGFDMQLTAPGTLDYFAAELRAFLGTLGPKTRSRAEALADSILNRFGRLNRYADALAAKNTELGRAGVTGAAQGAAIQAWDKSEGAPLRPVAEDLDRLQKAAGDLEHLLRKNSDSVASTPAERAGFMIRAITSLAGYGANLLEAFGKHSVEEAARYAVTGENRRDQINAENLRWLIDKAYAGRKIIVWAHSAHVMNAWYGKGFDSVSLEPVTKGMKPTGVWLASWYGNALYKIGFTTYQGSDGWVGAPPAPVPPAPLGSLEERLHRLGAPEVFLPLRSLPATPVSMRIPKYKVETIANPAQPFDAVYFIDTMKPATVI